MRDIGSCRKNYLDQRKGHDIIQSISYSLIVVDDEDISREGSVNLIDWNSVGFQVVASFSDGADARDFLEETPVDVVLTDIRMTELSGIDLAAYLDEHHPDTKIVLISGFRRFDYVKQAIRYRVYHYLLKLFPLQEIDELFARI